MSPSSSAGIPITVAPATTAMVRTEFAQHRRLAVRQRRRWLELLTDWEAKNSYAVYDEEGQHALQVKEEGSGLLNILKRLFFRTARPFKATVYDNPIPKPLLLLDRPFRWFFQRIDVAAADGTMLGSVVREWSWLRRIYRVEDANGREVARLFGPILKPWTFEIHVDGVVRGTIQKRWSGMVKELFTDADNFAVEMGEIDDPTLRALCFASTVLIDIVHFENRQN
ncbi:MAG TPA: phospholipid scramblase-related protein [Myxococcota bacterium]